MQSLTVRLRTIASTRGNPPKHPSVQGGGRQMNYPDVPPIVVACAQRALLRFQRFVTLSHEQQADARQVAILSAWEAYITQNEPATPALLFRSAWNALRRWWYAEKRWQDPTTPLDYQDEDGEWCCVEMADPCAEEEMEHALVRLELEECFKRLGLSQQERELLELLGEGFSQREVAQRLGKSQGWVWSKLSAICERTRAINRESDDSH